MARDGEIIQGQHFFVITSASAGVKICLANLAKNQNFL